MIRNVKIEDAGAICDIYNHYVQNTFITFEEDPVPVDEMRSRIADLTPSLPWLVSEENGKVVGYAYASQWKSRCAYRFSVESTIYLHADFIGKGLGKRLYESLISELRNRSFHGTIGGIALPNEGSVALHESLGFVKVAHFREVGRKFGRWVDVGYWQLLF
jgi:L-amino acid N-acyltransferase YncA